MSANLKTSDFYEEVQEHLEAIEALYEEYGFADDKEEYDSVRDEKGDDNDEEDVNGLFRFIDLIKDAKTIADQNS